MSNTGPVLARVASTAAEAKVLVALLRGEGIEATVDGDSLADEIAVSRRMMNLNGVQILVPAAQLEQARAFLADTAVPQDELEAQALAAPVEIGPAEVGPAPASAAAAAVGARPRRRRLLPLLIVLGVALLLALWVVALWLIDSLGDPARR
jgi:hypothetical protein